MGSPDKRILERALARGLLTKEQATALARLRTARKEDGKAASVDALAVEAGYLTSEQAARLREEEDSFSKKREIGGYRLVEKIGSGTMGTVYRAVQLSLDRPVAVKILSPHLSHKKEYVDRFLKEARSVAKLNHPNVISGIDVGQAEGLHYFVMEYAAGITVGKLLERGGAMDEERVLRIALQIARALEHAHDAGLVHRDVKPENILITKDGVAKLCDLGLAKDRPEEGVVLGTAAYVSPEQAQGLNADIRSDLYSFGATLYHMLTGRPPFTGEARAVLRKQIEEKPQPPSAVEPDVDPATEALVMKLLEKDAAQRYQTPKQLIAALEALAEQRRRAATQVAAPLARRRR